MKWLTIIAHRRPRRSVSWKAKARAQIPPTCWMAFNRPSWEELGLWKSKRKWSRKIWVCAVGKDRLQRKAFAYAHYYLQPVQVSNTWRPCWWKVAKRIMPKKSAFPKWWKQAYDGKWSYVHHTTIITVDGRIDDENSRIPVQLQHTTLGGPSLLLLQGWIVKLLLLEHD